CATCSISCPTGPVPACSSSPPPTGSRPSRTEKLSGGSTKTRSVALCSPSLADLGIAPSLLHAGSRPRHDAGSRTRPRLRSLISASRRAFYTPARDRVTTRFSERVPLVCALGRRLRRPGDRDFVL